MFVENSLWSHILFVRSSVSAVSYFSCLYISLLAVFLGMPLPYLRNFPVDIYPVNCTFQAWEVLHPLPIHVFQLWVCGINLFVKLRKERAKKKAKLKKDGMTERTQMTTIDHLCLFLLYVVMRLSWFHSAAISKPPELVRTKSTIFEARWTGPDKFGRFWSQMCDPDKFWWNLRMLDVIRTETTKFWKFYPNMNSQIPENHIWPHHL